MVKAETIKIIATGIPQKESAATSHPQQKIDKEPNSNKYTAIFNCPGNRVLNHSPHPIRISFNNIDEIPDLTYCEGAKIYIRNPNIIENS